MVDPQVFADGDPQSPVAVSVMECDLSSSTAWPEITRFVKDVVTGQKLLTGHHLIAADLHEGDGVEQLRMQGIVCWISDSHQKSDVRMTGGQTTAESVEGLPLPL